MLDGEREAQLLALVCGESPQARAWWTLHLLCDELRNRKVVESVSHETIRQVLRKLSNPGGARCGVCRPTENAAFVGAMEQALDVYKLPHDPHDGLDCYTAAFVGGQGCSGVRRRSGCAAGPEAASFVIL